MSSFLQDVRYALRALRRGWALSLIAVLSLALAVAGNCVVFSMVEAFLLRPFPYKDSESLHVVWVEQVGQTNTAFSMSPRELVDFRERSNSLAQLEGFSVGLRNLEVVDQQPRQVQVGLVTTGLLDFLGARAIIGRGFGAEDGRTGAAAVVLISHDFWVEEFGEDRDIVGRSLDLNEERHTVIGVLNPEFELIVAGTHLFTPLSLDRSDLSTSRSLFAFARLKPGVSPEQARQEIELIGAQLAEDYPVTNRSMAGRVDLVHNRFPDPRNRPLFAVIQGIVICVLLIACVNIANLLLARSYRRQQEFALRSALGADRSRIVRQLITESLLLAAIGGTLGTGLGSFGIRLLSIQLSPLLPRHWLPGLDPMVLAFSLGLTLVAGLLFGVAPAWQTLRTDVVETLKEGGRGSALGSRRSWLPRALVVAEVCLALVLLTGAAVLIEGFGELQRADLGIDADNLLINTVSLPASSYPDAARVNTFVDRLVPELAGLPGVHGATVASGVPRSPFSLQLNFSTEAMSQDPEMDLPSAIRLVVDSTYLKTMGIPLLKGRDILDADTADSPRVMIVSRTLAERYFPGEEPLGERLQVGGEWYEIVGVAADVMHEFFRDESGSKPAIYISRRQASLRTFWVLLRTGTDPHDLAEPMRLKIESLDSGITVGQAQTPQEFINRFLIGARAIMAILVGFGFVALALAALGIYGVLSYSVVQRSHEIGIRVALGAGRRQVLGSVLKQGGGLAVVGCLLALPIIPLVTNLVQQGLQGLVTVEPLVVVAVAALLLTVALVASYLPARRAAGVDPLIALRMD